MVVEVETRFLTGFDGWKKRRFRREIKEDTGFYLNVIYRDGESCRINMSGMGTSLGKPLV